MHHQLVDLGAIFVAIAATAAGGVAAYYLQRFVERLSRTRKGTPNGGDEKRKDEIEEISRALGYLHTEIGHCLFNIELGKDKSLAGHYADRCREYCMRYRELSRRLASLGGPDYVEAVRSATDEILEFLGRVKVRLALDAESDSENLIVSRWSSLRGQLFLSQGGPSRRVQNLRKCFKRLTFKKSCRRKG